MTVRRALPVALVAAAAAIALWYLAWPGDAASIRRQLHGLADEINESPAPGLGGAARARKIGQYFTEDVVVDLGQGTAPIHGRDAVVLMVARLEPRTAEFNVSFEDVNVDLSGRDANVRLTAEIASEAPGAREPWMDAREFSVSLTKTDEGWLIGHVRAVDTIR